MTQTEMFTGWIFPKSDEDMPAPGQRVYAIYRDDRAGCGHSGAVLMTPIHADGSHMRDGESVYRPVICWHALPDVPEAFK